MRTQPKQLINRINIIVFIASSSVLTLSLLKRDLCPYLFGGNEYTFRPDNFWAYSSGFFRRGFVGELIYWLDIITGYGPRFFSAILLTSFVLSAITAILIARRNTTIPEQILICISPIFLLYRVDSEILLFLPFAVIFLWNGKNKNYFILVSIILSMCIREIALLYYFPVLLGFVFSRNINLRISSISALAAWTFCFIFLHNVNYNLEHTYWPNQGITNLMDNHLYKFSTMPFKQVIFLHVGFIYDNILLITPGILSFFTFAYIYIVKKYNTIIPAVWFLLTTALFFILTVDYGRYYYFLFIFLLFFTCSTGRKYFQFKEISYIGHLVASPILSRIDNFSSGYINRCGLISLLIFALSPSGFWADSYTIYPRVLNLSIKIAKFLFESAT